SRQRTIDPGCFHPCLAEDCRRLLLRVGKQRWRDVSVVVDPQRDLQAGFGANGNRSGLRGRGLRTGGGRGGPEDKHNCPSGICSTAYCFLPSAFSVHVALGPEPDLSGVGGATLG